MPVTATGALLTDAPFALTGSKKKPHRRALVSAKGDGAKGCWGIGAVRSKAGEAGPGSG